MDYATLANFLKNKDFKSNEYFQHLADYSSGAIGSVLGMTIYPTTQVGTGKVWAFEKDHYAVAAIRRDELITNIRNDGTLSQGLNISSRFGWAYQDPRRVIMATVTAPS